MPTRTPASTPPRIANAGSQWCAHSSPKTTEASPYTAPTDRSIPPEIRTKVPAAAMHERRGLLIDDIQQVGRGQERREDPIDSATNRRTNGNRIPALRHANPGSAWRSPWHGKSDSGTAGPERRSSRWAELSIGAHAASSVIAGSENAAARIADSLISSIDNSLATRPRRITKTRWAKPEYLLKLGRDQATRRCPRPRAPRSGHRLRAWRRRRLRGWASSAISTLGGTSASARTTPSAGCRPTEVPTTDSAGGARE